MLRTIVLRNQTLGGTLKKTVRSNVTRCISTQLFRRKQSNRLAASSHKALPAIQWSMQVRYYADLPPHEKINLPALSPTMEKGSIVSWAKKEGDKLSDGDLLCEIETDKATMGFETPEEGYLAKILIPEGSKGVPVGKLLCIIVENQADVAAFKDFKDDSAAAPAAPPKAEAAAAPAAPPKAEAAAAPAAPPEAAAAAPAAPAAPAAHAAAPASHAAAPAPAPASAHGRVYASPLAKRLAELRNLRLGGAAAAPAAAAAGSAPSAPAPGASFVDIPLTSMRETIAKRLAVAKQSIPHYQLSITVNIEKTMKLRETVNKKWEKSGVKPQFSRYSVFLRHGKYALNTDELRLKKVVSVNDIIIKAVASACKRVPAVNSYWHDTFIRQFSHVDVSVAVATPTGLITPIIFNADSRGIIDISKSMKELAQKARDGELQPKEFQGGTVTISNLGMYGITMFNAIINPPQAMIVACGGVQTQVILDDDASQGFRTAKFATFTASADHRVIDGAVGAEFMKALKENLEDPANIVL